MRIRACIFLVFLAMPFLGAQAGSKSKRTPGNKGGKVVECPYGSGHRPTDSRQLKKIPGLTRNCLCDFKGKGKIARCKGILGQLAIDPPADKFSPEAEAIQDEADEIGTAVHPGNSGDKGPGNKPEGADDEPGGLGGAETEGAGQAGQYEGASDISGGGSDLTRREAGLYEDVFEYSNDSKQRLLNHTTRTLDGMSRSRETREEDLSHDYQIYERAVRHYESKKGEEKFTLSEAASAKNDEVRESLMLYSRMDEIGKDAQASHAAAQKKLVELEGMTATNRANEGSLSPIHRDGGGYSNDAAEAEKLTSGIQASGDAAKLSAGAAGAETEVSAGEKEGQKEGAGGGSIRDLLRAKLKANLKNGLGKARGLASGEAGGDEGGILGGFQGELKSAQASPESEMAAEKEIQRLFGENGSSFSMAHSDTDRFVKKAIGELDDIQQGILETDSLDLFKRVKTYHDACARRGCVGQAQGAFEAPNRR